MSEPIIITEFSQLDALVAEKVMQLPDEYGLKKRGYWYRPNACGYTDSVSEAWRVSYEEAKKHEYPHDEPVTMIKFEPRKYSTDIAAASSVLEKLRSQNRQPMVSAGEPSDDWHCGCSPMINKYATTASLAICLTALAAHGINVKLEIKP